MWMTGAHFQPQSDPPRATMTSQEAEQVMALWAERQQQIHSMPSVRELSEVLNAPPSEVYQLLDEVRQKEVTPVVKPKRSLANVRRNAIVAGLLMLMVVSSSVGYVLGNSHGRRSSALVYQSFDQAFSSPSVSPKGYQVAFDGYIMPRGTSAPTSEQALVTDLNRAVLGAVKQMTPDNFAYSQASLSSTDFVTKLQEGEKVSGVLDFRKATIKGPKGKGEVLIPVLLTSHPEWESLVRAEQERRAKQLVSQVFESKTE
jgi:hypothetical protein